MQRSRKAFTLVEILIVVVILGILASIVVPQFASATSDAQRTAVTDQVAKIREEIAVYYVRNGNTWPDITAGDGTWGSLLSANGNYMRKPPANMWVGGANAKIIVLGTAPDSTYQTDYGWIFDATSGELWAGGCDGHDQVLPRP